LERRENPVAISGRQVPFLAGSGGIEYLVSGIKESHYEKYLTVYFFVWNLSGIWAGTKDS
jgi:hypothetical protein